MGQIFLGSVREWFPQGTEKRLYAKKEKLLKGEINESFRKAHESRGLREKVREAWVISLRSQHILAVQLPFGHPLFPAFNPGL